MQYRAVDGATDVRFLLVNPCDRMPGLGRLRLVVPVTSSHWDDPDRTSQTYDRCTSHS